MKISHLTISQLQSYGRYNSLFWQHSSFLFLSLPEKSNLFTIMVYTVESADTSSGERFISAVYHVLSLDGAGDPKRVTFDCEGVNLSRLGTLELVSICFENMEVYLIDFGGRVVCPRILGSVKSLFESDLVTKIIHDCRKDCDALYHHHSIKLRNVHDTSCFHDIITNNKNKNLNDVLMYNGIHVNSARDNSVYNYVSNTRYLIKWISFLSMYPRLLLLLLSNHSSEPKILVYTSHD